MNRNSPLAPRGVVLAIGVALLGGPALASIPLEPASPAGHAGAWELVSDQGRCMLTLGQSPAPGGLGWSIDSGRSCLIDLGLSVTAWRLEPDGLALVAPDRSTVVFLSRTGPETYASVGAVAMALSRPSNR
jgi:hypothetical protein